MFSLSELLEGQGTRLLYDDATIGCKNLRTLSRKDFGKAQRKALESANENVIDALEQVFTQEIMQAFSSLATSVSSLVPAGIGVTESIANQIARTAVADVTPDFEQAFRDMHQYAQDRALTITMATTTTDPENFRRTDLVQTMERAHQQRLASLLPTLTEQTRRAIVEAVRDNIENNRNPLQAKKTIRDAVQGASLYPGVAAEKGEMAALSHRASVIARTEVAWARNHASITYLQQSDDVEGLYCVDGPDCGWHDHDDPDKANGKHVTFDEARDYPISHPNCRRSFGPRFRAYEPPAGPAGEVPDIPKSGKGLEKWAGVRGTGDNKIWLKEQVATVARVLPGVKTSKESGYLTIGREQQRGGTLGLYAHDQYGGRISISPDVPDDLGRLVTYHEIGHAFDRQLLGPASLSSATDQWVFRSDRVAPPPEDFDRLIRAIRETPEMKELIRIRTEGGGPYEAEAASYLSQTDEAFARAFSQYIALRAGDEAALAALYRQTGKTEMLSQWKVSTFQPIADAFDELFKNRGMR